MKSQLKKLTTAKLLELHKSKPICHAVDTITAVKEFFSIGGAVSGGAAIAYLQDSDTKDIDFYFNDEDNYLYASSIAPPRIDVCWYFESPYELHDLDLTQIAIFKDEMDRSGEYDTAWAFKMSHIIGDCMVYPRGTAARILKYNTKYGFKFYRNEVLALCARYNLLDMAEKLILTTLAI